MRITGGLLHGANRGVVLNVDSAPIHPITSLARMLKARADQCRADAMRSFRRCNVKVPSVCRVGRQRKRVELEIGVYAFRQACITDRLLTAPSHEADPAPLYRPAKPIPLPRVRDRRQTRPLVVPAHTNLHPVRRRNELDRSQIVFDHDQTAVPEQPINNRLAELLSRCTKSTFTPRCPDVTEHQRACIWSMDRGADALDSNPSISRALAWLATGRPKVSLMLTSRSTSAEFVARVALSKSW